MLTRRDFLGVMGGAAGLLAAGCGTSTRDLALSERGASIQRQRVLARHDIRVRRVDPEMVLSAGNGNFAFNVDCTGLQSLPTAYALLPLVTLSHWAWHTIPAPAGVDVSALRYQQWDFHGRKVPYATSAVGQEPLFNYLRENPHRLNLGRIGLVLDEKPLTPGDLTDIEQTLDLYSGLITSRFTLGGGLVEVMTCAHGDRDAIGLRVRSPLWKTGRLALQFEFGYGSNASSGDGADWNNPSAHQTTLSRPEPNLTLIGRQLDAMRYGVLIASPSPPTVRRIASHRLLMQTDAPELECTVEFLRDGIPMPTPATFEDARRTSAARWNEYWQSGAFIDLGDCTDLRAPELERRIILSQYLTGVHCAGEWPSAETGLFCNSWYGKFHLEMHWWHTVHFAAWGRWTAFEKSMGVYARFLESAKARAKQQGFAGARWPKMTSPDGTDAPSNIGPLLIWQQPHPIYYAELLYRAKPTRETLETWREIVMESAEFMASFAQRDDRQGAAGGFVLGPAIKTVSENAQPETTYNPTYELSAWRFGLKTAQAWRERLGIARNAKWDEVLLGLATAPQRDGVYLMQEGQDTFTYQWMYEHPAMLGALGVLPEDGIDPAVMARTVQRVRAGWDFSRVWGWDFPMAAMAAARTGQAELVIDFLLMDSPMNRYIGNGVNSPRPDIPAYLPGNGGLLAAIAMMAGGWTGGPIGAQAPGFPRNGRWRVRAEGFGRWL